jgi:hypothetical protein
MSDAEATFAEMFPAKGAFGDPHLAALCARCSTLSRQRGLSNGRNEFSKYTDLRALMRDVKPLASPHDALAKERARNAGVLKDLDLPSFEIRRNAAANRNERSYRPQQHRRPLGQRCEILSS